MSSTNDDSAVGARLYEVRERLGFAQQGLAEALGIALRTYQNYERGDRPISKEVLCVLVERFKVDANWLLSGRELEIKEDQRIKAEIDLSLFRRVQEALRSDYSEFRKANAPMFCLYTASIYNQAVLISDQSLQERTIRSSVALASKAVVLGSLERTEQRYDEFVKASGEKEAKKMLDRMREETSTRVRELEAYANHPEPPEKNE